MHNIKYFNAFHPVWTKEVLLYSFGGRNNIIKSNSWTTEDPILHLKKIE